MAQQIHPKNVVGRDVLIERIWHKLESGSLRFTAERRIGKTTVMKKMCAEPKKGYTPVFIDLEGIRSPKGFVEKLFNSVRELRSVGDRGSDWLSKLLQKLGGTEVSGVIKFPKIAELGWDNTLNRGLEGLCSHQSETCIVLLFDEIPYMLQNIGGKDALNILDPSQSDGIGEVERFDLNQFHVVDRLARAFPIAECIEHVMQADRAGEDHP